MAQKIIIRDRVYGSFSSSEPVLIALIKSKTLQRLKKISQFGIPDEYYHVKNFYRYEHSVGVMILIKKLGGSLEEQIAGLLHDVSHTAFSHIVDWVVGEAGDETYQDTKHEDIIQSGEISRILKKFHYNPKRISDYHNFRLLERDIPNLCADRVDYALREFPKRIARYLVQNITSHKEMIVFKNKKAAEMFALNFLKLQTEHWGGFEAVSRFKLFSRALKLAINDGLISMADFLEDDAYVMRKLKKTKNEQILHILKILSNKKLPTAGKKEIVHKKFRYTDPLFFNQGAITTVSEASPALKKYLERQKQLNQRGVRVPSY